MPITPKRREWEVQGGRMVRDKGLYVLQLNGGYRDMGRQFGELIFNVCGAMNIDYYGGLVGRMLKHSSALGELNPVARRFAHSAIDSFFKTAAYRNSPESMRELMAGLMAALQVKPETMQRLSLAMDISHVLMSVQFGYLASGGCSALVAKDSATADGRLIFGRNYDFHGAGFWDIYPAVVVYNPDSGMKVISVTTLGIPHGSVAINEAGLVLGVFANYTKDLATDGTPGYSLWHRIITECRTVDHVIKLIESTRRICGFTIIALDADRDAAAIELSASKHAVVRLKDDVMARSNNYQSPKMQKQEAVWETMYRYNHARSARIAELLEELRGRLDPQAAVDIMGDHLDYFERRKTLAGNVVGTVCNINCTIVSPDEGAFWIGTGRAPTCNSPEFAGLDIQDLFNGGDGLGRVPSLRGDRVLDDCEAQAVRDYVEAWSEHFDGFDDERALERLEEAISHLDNQPVFRLLAGVTAMKLGRFYDALDHLERFCEFEFKTPHLAAEGRLWLGRTHDILEQRKQALEAYAMPLSCKVESLAARAREHVSKPYTRDRLARVELEFILGLPIEG